MSVTTQNNILDVFVAKDASVTAGTSLTNDLATSLADGQIAVVGYDPVLGYEKTMLATFGASSNAAPINTNCPYIRFVMKNGSDLYYGSKIYGKDLFAVSQKAYAAPQEQIYVMGYNGSSGSLDVSSANEFIFTIAYDHDDMMWSEQKLRNSYDYYSTAPTQKGLAQSMTAQINYKENLGKINGTGAMVSAVMLADGTGTALTNSRTVAVVNGSNYITLSGALSTNFAVGDLIRLGSGALATTDPVYVITALGDATGANTTTVFQIHTPYQGASGTIANANAGTVGTTTNYGFKITGQALSWTKDFFKFMKVKFHFDLKGFGLSTLTKTQESKKGSGYYQEVSELESFAAGNQGALNRMVVPLPIGRSMVATNTATANSGYDQYNVWYIESRDTANASPIVATTPMRIQTMLFFTNNTNGDAAQVAMSQVAGSNGQGLAGWLSSWGFSGIAATAI